LFRIIPSKVTGFFLIRFTNIFAQVLFGVKKKFVVRFLVFMQFDVRPAETVAV
jgi:hypothetical protein